MNVYRCIKNEEEFSLMCKELNKLETYHSEEYNYEIRKLDRNKDKYNKMPIYKKIFKINLS